jgi:hypothetical protein
MLMRKQPGANANGIVKSLVADGDERHPGALVPDDGSLAAIQLFRASELGAVDQALAGGWDTRRRRGDDVRGCRVHDVSCQIVTGDT